jgi:hypothetical protein
VKEVEGYGTNCGDESDEDITFLDRIENAEKDLEFYKEYLYKSDHTNYVAYDKQNKPVIISIAKEGEKDEGTPNLKFKIVIRTSMVHSLPPFLPLQQ